MTNVISEADAKGLAIAIGTAIIQEDKKAREKLYQDLSTDDLKRIIRWQSRFLLRHTVALSQIMGVEPEEYWRHFAMQVAFSDLEFEE